MADSKDLYSNASSKFVIKTVPYSTVDKDRFERSKKREQKFNKDWQNQKVNINDIIDKFAPNSAGYSEGVKFIFKGQTYDVITDMASGYLRIRDKKGNYIKLDGTPGDNKSTHFKIKKKEEM